MGKALHRHTRWWLLAATCGLLATTLIACDRPVYKPPPAKSLAQWADPKSAEGEPCVAETAKAILASGLPYPRFTTEEEVDSDGRRLERIKTVDVWVGKDRYVLPAKLVKDNGLYEKNDPRRFWGLGGSLPNFWPPGPPGPEVDGMGSMVDVRITCMTESRLIDLWGKGSSTQDGIEKTRQHYIQELAADPRYPGTVTYAVRDDLGMHEVLMNRFQEANGQRWWEASYWPVTQEMRSGNGVAGIRCIEIRHDTKKRYAGVGWRCRTPLALTPYSNVTIDIYVSQLSYMPKIFEQVGELFKSAKQN